MWVQMKKKMSETFLEENLFLVSPGCPRELVASTEQSRGCGWNIEEACGATTSGGASSFGRWIGCQLEALLATESVKNRAKRHQIHSNVEGGDLWWYCTCLPRILDTHPSSQNIPNPTGTPLPALLRHTHRKSPSYGELNISLSSHFTATNFIIRNADFHKNLHSWSEIKGSGQICTTETDAGESGQKTHQIESNTNEDVLEFYW